ncbi:MAG: hypothetical protein NWQ13_09835 [Glaciimonas sp.]|nr:hypothetical protein [Glaciimonas sp.]
MLNKSFFKSNARALLLCTGAALLLSACSPAFNWRQVQSNDAPYSVMLPAKPATFTREVDLDGIKINMTMMAAEVENTVFAVGSAKVADTQHTAVVLQAIKTALLKNINGRIKVEKTTAQRNNADTRNSIVIEAVGTDTKGQATSLFAHLQSKNQQIYQVMVIGPENGKAVSRDNIDTFMESFKPS